MGTNVCEVIDNLAELAAYTCRNVSGKKEWYMECVDCKSVGKCHCGSRAVELLERETYTGKNLANLKKRETARRSYVKALCSTDPKKWLADNLGLDHNAATRRLSLWKHEYPDIAHKYNHPDLRKKNTFSKAGNKANTLSVMKTRETLKILFSSENPLQSVMDHYGTNRKKARDYITRWIKKHPDWAEEFHMREVLDRTKLYKSHKEDEKPMTRALDPILHKEDDELSVSEFLEEEMSKDNRSVRHYFNSTQGNEAEIFYTAIDLKRKEIQEQIDTLRTQLTTLNSAYYIMTGKIPE